MPRSKTLIGVPPEIMRTVRARAKPRRVFRPDPAGGPLPARRRRALRYGIDASVQLQLSRSLAIFARATEVSKTGIRIHVHGNAVPGQRFRVVLRPGASSDESVTAEVRWVGRSDLDGVRPVGLQWVDNAPASRPRIDSLVERARGIY